TNLSFIVGEGKRIYIRILGCALLAVCFISCVTEAGAVWALGDMGYATLGVINFIALILLSRIAMKTLKDYDSQRRQGLNPEFDPARLGIKHADFWEELRADEVRVRSAEATGRSPGGDERPADPSDSQEGQQ